MSQLSKQEWDDLLGCAGDKELKIRNNQRWIVELQKEIDLEELDYTKRIALENKIDELELKIKKLKGE